MTVRRIVAKIIIAALIMQQCLMITIGAEDAYYKNASGILASLGITDELGEEGQAAEDTVLRGDFTVAVIRFLGLYEAAEAAPFATDFYDVTISHPASGSINIALQLGIISHNERHMFFPDDMLTFEQAVKMVVSALRYDAPAQSRGGFPHGYVFIASQLGLLKGIGEASGAEISRRDAVILLYNALGIDAAVTKYDKAGEALQFDTGMSNLAANQSSQISRGMITATKSVSLKGNAGLADDEVAIDIKSGSGIINENFKIGMTNAPELLGRNVRFLYKETRDGEKTILYISEDENATETITIENDKISGVTGVQTANATVTYIDEQVDMQHKLQISEKAVYIYNGGVISEVQDSDLIPEIGYITLIENTGDNKYDIVFITDFTIGVVSAVAVDQPVIFTKGANTYDLGMFGSGSEWTVMKEDSKISYADLREWDAIAVARSRDKKVTYIQACETVISGVVSEISDEGYGIDGQFYKVRDTANLSSIKIGASGDFLLDCFGGIAWVKLAEEEQDEYVYLIKATKTKGMSNIYRFMLLDESSEVKVLEVDPKVIINDEKLKGDLLAALQLTNADGTKVYFNPGGTDEKTTQLGAGVTQEEAEAGVAAGVYQRRVDQLLKVRISEDNIIKNIEKAEPVPYSSNFSKDFDGNSTSNGAGRVGRFKITENTLIYQVPAFVANLSNLKYYQKVNRGAFTKDNQFGIQIYDSSDLNVARVAILKTTKGGSSGNVNIQARSAFVERITEMVNEEGQVVWAAKMFWRGEEVLKQAVFSDDDDLISIPQTPICIKDVAFRDLKYGDIIQFNLNADGYIDAFKVVFRASDNMPYFDKMEMGAAHDPRNNIVNGEIIIRDGKTIAFATSSEQPIRRVVNIANDTGVLEYSPERNKYIVSDESYLQKGKKVVLHIYMEKLNDVLILPD
ncbi:MAG: hypothetical protein M0R40_04370 [Firmicutes bacterium]|nr:hypothetical protein [Bacillota bacterium]